MDTPMIIKFLESLGFAVGLNESMLNNLIILMTQL